MAAIPLMMLILFTAFLQVRCQQVDKFREDTTVDIAHYGEIKTAITTNKTKAFLSCESGDMIVTVDFNDPFFGIIYANRDPLSPCNVEGNGKSEYTIRLPLQGCGTREDPPRTFINDIVVRFRRGLIVDEDEVKTIICRYGPPVPPPILPLTPLPPLPVEPPGIVAKPKKLTEAEIYVIICFLLFLALLLLGVGLAYYCLKKRNIKIVRKRRALSTVSAPASEITKLSGSTMGTLSAFDGFRIPRATAHSVSGSEAALLTAADHMSDILPSDYPSESPSSYRSEEMLVETRRDTLSRSLEEYEQRVLYAPSQPRSLTTIYEQQDRLQRSEEQDQSVLSARRLLQHQLLPPVYAKIRKKQLDSSQTREETTLESNEEYTSMMRFTPLPPPTVTSHTRSVSELMEETEVIPYQQLEEEEEEEEEVVEEEESMALRLASPPPPATVRHTIDDYYLTTITETQTQEDQERRTRETTHTHSRDVPRWDVMIRTYPPEDDSPHRAPTVTTDSEAEQWDQLSYVSERDHAPQPPPAPTDWNVLIRVLKPSQASVRGDDDDDVDSVDELSEDDRERWKRIVTSDSRLRSRLQEARTVEELESIRSDTRYRQLFEPNKWDVIIRILSEPSPPDGRADDASSTVSEATQSITSSHSGTSGARRYRKKSDPMDNRSRRSSLPPVYEYEDLPPPSPTTSRSRRTSRSSDYDLQSEEDRYDWSRNDMLSEYLGGGGGPIARSIAERSTSEVVEDVSKVYQHSASSGSGGRSAHRQVERSSTEILVSSPSMRSSQYHFDYSGYRR